MPNQLIARLRTAARAFMRRMHQEGRPPIHSGLEQLHALLGRHPALHHHIIQFLAQELVHHILMLAADLEEIRQRSHWRHSLGQRSRFQQPPHRVRRVAMVANQRLQRIPPSGHLGHLAAQLVRRAPARRPSSARRACKLSRSATISPSNAFNRSDADCKPQPRLAALRPQILLLRLRLAHLGFQPLRLALQRRQALFALRRMVARIPGQRQQVHHVPPARLQLPLRRKNLFRRRARLLLPRLHLRPEGPRLLGRRRHKAALLLALLVQCPPTASASAPTPRRPP